MSGLIPLFGWAWSDMAEPFMHPFMLRAFAVGSLVAAVCAVLSCYLVLKGWSLLGDAVSHAALPGVALAYLAGWPFVVGAFAAGLGSVWIMGFIRASSRIKEDAAMGIVFTGFFAVGLVLITAFPSDVDLMHILFGSLLGISKNEMIQTAALGGAVLALALVWRRDLLAFCFDADHARAVGLNTKALYIGFLSLLSLTIVIALKAVGIVLVIAMLITPGATAFLVTRRFSRMMALAAGLAVFSACAGTYVSYFLDGATASCIVLVQAFLFLLAFLFAPRQGMLSIKRVLPAQTAAQSLPLASST